MESTEEFFDEEIKVSDEEMEETGDVNTDKVFAIDKISILSRSSASRLIKIIQEHLIMKLQRALAQRTPQDSCHRYLLL